MAVLWLLYFTCAMIYDGGPHAIGNTGVDGVYADLSRFAFDMKR